MVGIGSAKKRHIFEVSTIYIDFITSSLRCFFNKTQEIYEDFFLNKRSKLTLIRALFSLHTFLET